MTAAGDNITSCSENHFMILHPDYLLLLTFPFYCTVLWDVIQARLPQFARGKRRQSWTKRAVWCGDETCPRGEGRGMRPKACLQANAFQIATYSLYSRFQRWPASEIQFDPCKWAEQWVTSSKAPLTPIRLFINRRVGCKSSPMSFCTHIATPKPFPSTKGYFYISDLLNSFIFGGNKLDSGAMEWRKQEILFW